MSLFRRREEQQVEIRRQKREENIAERHNLAVEDGAVSVEDGSTVVRGSIPLSVLLLYEPAIPTPLPHYGGAASASPFARGNCLPRLTCFLSQVHPEAIQAIFSDNPARQLEATRGIRRLLSKKDNPPIDRIIASGVVPRFVEFLAGPRAALQVS